MTFDMKRKYAHNEGNYTKLSRQEKILIQVRRVNW